MAKVLDFKQKDGGGDLEPMIHALEDIFQKYNPSLEDVKQVDKILSNIITQTREQAIEIAFHLGRDIGNGSLK